MADLEGTMIAILRTLCGCEQAVNIPYPASPYWNVPIPSREKQWVFAQSFGGMPSSLPQFKTRRFERRGDRPDTGYPVYYEVPE